MSETPSSPESEEPVSADVRNIVRALASRAKERKQNQIVSDEALSRGIDILNEKNAIVEVDGDSYVARWGDPARPASFQLYTFDAWLRSVPVLQVVRNTAQGPKTVDLTKEWLRMPEARRYRGLGLYPEGEPEGTLNMWRGWGMQPRPGDCLIFKQFLLEVICGDDDEAYDYLWKWMAHGVQFPHECPRVAVVMIGKEGTGKGVFASVFGALFGDHFVKITSRHELTGAFNEHTQNALLLFSDEAAWGGDREETAELKSLITEPTRAIRAKYKKAYYIPNRMRFVFATNERWAINASAESRRFFVLNVSDRRMQDLDYFGVLTEHMFERGGCEALMAELLAVDLSDFRPMAVPKTRALSEQKVQSLKLGDRTVDQWFVECVAAGTMLREVWPAKWTAEPDIDKMYAEYLQFCESTKKKYPETELGFMRRMMSLRALLTWESQGLMLCPYERARQIATEQLGIPEAMLPAWKAKATKRKEEY